MTDRNGPFWPESLEAQLEQLMQASSHATRLTEPDARLVEDLRTVYTEYTHAGERVRARLAERLAEREETPHQVKLIPTESVQTERANHLQAAPEQFAPQAAPRPKSPRRSPRVFTLVAAVLVAVLLVGSTLWVLTRMHQPGGNALSASATAQAARTPTATPAPVLTFPCPPKSFDPVFRTLCQQHEIQVIQQRQELPGNQTLTLVAGYADINSVFMWYHLDHTGNTQFSVSGTASSPELASEPGNFSWSIGGCTPSDSRGQLECFDSWNLDNVPPGLRVLDLNLQVTVDPNSPGQTPTTATFMFSLPFHADRSAHPNLTVTANGIAVTLKQVLVSPFQTTIDLLNPQLNTAIMAASPSSRSYFTLTAGNQKLSSGIIADSLEINGKHSPVIGIQLVIDGSHPLLNQYGEWTLTISPQLFSGATTLWVFHFSVK